MQTLFSAGISTHNLLMLGGQKNKFLWYVEHAYKLQWVCYDRQRNKGKLYLAILLTHNIYACLSVGISGGERGKGATN